MVTNSLAFIDQSNLIVVMDHGEICECGTFPALVSQQGSFSALVQEHQHKRETGETADDNEVIEDDMRGALSWSIRPMSNIP